MSFEKWEEVKLGDVASYRTEKIDSSFLNSSNYVSTDNMLTDRGGLTQSEYVPTEGKASKYNNSDILVSNIRPYFKKIWLADKDGGCSNDVIVFKPNNKLITYKYLYYRLSNQDFFDFMMAGSNGTKMPRGNKNSIPSFLIKLPPLPTQKKIAKILSNYDALIENNLKQIKLLEEKARLTYEEWFLRFRIDGKKLEIDEETGLPFGWERVNVNSLYSIKYGKNLPQEKIKEQAKYPVYGASGQMGFYEKSNVNYSVILVTSRGNGSGDIHRTFGAGFVTNNSFIILPKDDYSYLSFEFTIYHLETIGLKNYCSGSAQPQLTNDAMKSIKIILPTQEHIKSYLNIVRPLIAVADNLRNQNQLLKESRDILLPRLMTGMIDVENLDIEV